MPQGRRLLVSILAAIATLVAVLPAAALASTYTVDSTGDLPDASPGDNVCKDTTDPPANAKCTLRAALMEANAHGGNDTIAFSLGTGLATITPFSQLPPIVEKVDVNGTSQPGWSGAPIIQISGQNAPADTDGIWVTGGSGTVVRGLIVNRFRIGIAIDDASDSTTVANDWLGLDASGFSAAPNRRSGVYVFNSNGNVIGGSDPAFRNVVSGNGVPGIGDADNWGKGIEIFGAGATGNQVLGNFVGTDLTGNAPVPNLRFGVWAGSGVGNLGTAANTDIGDGSDAGRNVISGNGWEGIYILDAPSTKIRGNIIGLGLNGNVMGNGYRGIALENAPFAQVGGTTPGERNVVSANGQKSVADNTVTQTEGIVVFGPNAKNDTIQGNYVGTNLAGDDIKDANGAATGNLGHGISLTTRTDNGGATDDLVGGSIAAQRNVVSGNATGVAIINRATTNRVEGNYIGTDKTGTVALGNKIAGVVLYAAEGNTIGGTLAGTGNLISGNDIDGVHLEGDEPLQKPAAKNKVQGNWIGVAADGTTALPNGGQNVAFVGRTSENVIGYDVSATDAQMADAKACSSGPCNRIQNSKNVGIWVNGDLSVKNTIRGNRISDNKFLGIDLKNDQGKVTPNDVDDSDTGSNDLLNFPVAVSYYQDPETGTKRVSGRIVGPNPELLKVDIYSNTAPDPIGAGEGKTWEASVTPKKNGTFVWEITGPTGGSFYSATATDPAGNTSEFSLVCSDPDGDGNPDSDNDGLCDDWEINGIDYDGDKVVDMPLNAAPYSADPLKKDIFVEVDYLDALFHDHQPETGALTDVVTAFANSPVDGGKGIALHVTPGDADGSDDDINEVTNIKTVSRGPGADDDFVDLRDGDPAQPCDGNFGTAAERGAGADTCWKILGAKAMAFRYAIFGHDFTECNTCSGIADDGGDNFFITLGAWSNADLQRDGGGLGTCLNTANCKRQVEAGTFMHEMGHTMLLGHAGRLGVDDAHNYKPNYLSVMNYTFQFRRTVPTRPLDYSRWALATLNESALLEGNGIDNNAPPAGLAGWGSTAFTRYDAGADKCPFQNVPTVGDIDWNWNGPIEGAAIAAGINEPDAHPNVGLEACQDAGNYEVLKGHDDWTNLHLDHRDIEGWNELGAGDVEPNPAPELTEVQQQEQAELSDSDGDGVDNATDNCNTIPNPGQEDLDGDGIGDVCQGAPVNLTAPGIVQGGAIYEGDTLTVDKGNWAGNAPIGYTDQWLSCNAAGGDCQPLATGAQYTVAAGDVGRRIKVMVTATNDKGSASKDSALTEVVIAEQPVNKTPPQVSGTIRDGETLSSDAGQWTGRPAIAYAYQWRRCAADGTGCGDVAGATNPQYTAGTSDIGKTLRVRVTATNGAGSAFADSAATAVVAAIALGNTALPAVSGTPQVGQALTTTLGSWTGSDPKAFAIAWLRCDAAGAGCAPIAGATAATYTATAADEGHAIRARVTATNPAGDLARESAAAGPVTAAPAGGPGGNPGGPFGPITPPGLGGAGGPTPDTTPPALTVAIPRAALKGLLRTGRMAVTVGCSEACRVRATLTQAKARKGRRARLRVAMATAGSAAAVPAAPGVPAGGGGRAAARTPAAAVIGTGAGQVAANAKKAIVVRLTKKARKALKRARSLSATLQVTATDAAGNAASAKRSVRARR